MNLLGSLKIKVGARGSKLSLKQVEEAMGEIGESYELVTIETRGDRDLKSSLGPMDKTDFFTQEIDRCVLRGECDVGIHSAKDLPEPLPKGLMMVALTRGVDPSDSLVLPEKETLSSLRKGAFIGSSSPRRDKVVKGLRPDLFCREVRGPVDRRLEMLDQGEIDGLVVAEAALIRLGLTERNRITLPGKVAPLQGQLAVIARSGDEAMKKFFQPMDTRRKKRVLYLGTEKKKNMEHFPVIDIVPRNFHSFELKTTMADIADYTHVIFTSKNGVHVFWECMKAYGATIEGKKVYAVGKATAHALEEKGIPADKIASEETQEGLIHMLALEDLDESYVLLPQSSRARPALEAALRMRRVRHQKISLYDPRKKIPRVKPDLETFDEIIFTSPSTVEAFHEIFPAIPKRITLTPIGPITERALKIKI